MAGNDGEEGTESWQAGDDQPLETERLALDDEDDRLPWLESDEDYDDDGGSDLGGTLKLGLLALVALGAIVAGIYWVTHRNPDPMLSPDGSLVQADPQPYKEAPKDPGGKTFDGTGDTSFAVSEGQTKPAQMAQPSAAAPAPVPQASASAAAPAASGGVGVQVGAFSSKDAAEAGWSKLVGSAGGALSGVSHRVIQGTADNGTIFRLQAVAGNAEAAQALCGRLKAAGVSCQVK